MLMLLSPLLLNISSAEDFRRFKKLLKEHYFRHALLTFLSIFSSLLGNISIVYSHYFLFLLLCVPVLICKGRHTNCYVMIVVNCCSSTIPLNIRQILFDIFVICCYFAQQLDKFNINVEDVTWCRVTMACDSFVCVRQHKVLQVQKQQVVFQRVHQIDIDSLFALAKLQFHQQKSIFNRILVHKLI